MEYFLFNLFGGTSRVIRATNETVAIQAAYLLNMAVASWRKIDKDEVILHERIGEDIFMAA